MNKLHAKSITIDNITFRSLLEGRRYSQLKLLLANGDIRDLELQPKYPIIITSLVTGKQSCMKRVLVYHADFRYYDVLLGETIIEDTKGFMTTDAKLRIKIVEALYEIEIVILRRDDF